MNELDDNLIIDETFFDPYLMTSEQLETVRRIALVIMDKDKCVYTKAVIIAYIEWLGMAEVEKQRH